MTRISDTRDGQMEACLSTVSLPPDPNHPDVAADRFHKPLLHPQVMRLIRDETGQAIGHHSHSTGRLAEKTIVEGVEATDHLDQHSKVGHASTRRVDLGVGHLPGRRQRRESEPTISLHAPASFNHPTFGQPNTQYKVQLYIQNFASSVCVLGVERKLFVVVCGHDLVLIK
ncbi:uncharacterized protein LOC108672559 [Hyalella azteca]|uniref:Uncharacterized protein LOC108672559 n=1 Tax=Hyalella azteca TaxID=294128 RepID=A0A8B7NRQ2_HYAAZ|nr:uncharacterized protein LOC108672559 [Hyalella azteca]